MKSIILGFLLSLPVLFVSAFAGDCVAPPAGMVGWWPGDNDTNDIVNGNNGSVVGAVSYVPGEVDNAFAIGSLTETESLSGYVQVPNNIILEPASVTVDAWVKASNPGRFKYIFSKGANACQVASYGLYTGGSDNGGLLFYVSDGTNFAASVDAGSGIWDGAWHHVAGTFDNATKIIRLYVNGEEVGGGTQTSLSIQYNFPTSSDNSNDIRIGSYLNSACPGENFSFVGGEIDEVEVFNRALSLAEIQSIFNAKDGGKCKTITVNIDIKPGSDPNCFNINGHGVIPVAVLGDMNFDVTQIDQTSLLFGGMEVRVRGNKGPQCSYQDTNLDGYSDLVCQFEDNPDYWVAGDSEAKLTGKLLPAFGERAIEGSDSICIVP